MNMHMSMGDMVRATSTKNMDINAMGMHIHTKRRGMGVTGMLTRGIPTRGMHTKASSTSMATHMSINMSTANPRKSEHRLKV
eukprot:CAMPEP_0172184674 /NCGR_PEP_ID=MMETSP1050-20130122/19714_1 /TAXON_ID=233186 /ORGANISM="Cryptomonas curvata, Strain CCAP979/52" /LENGTH=81 /DNA_ID=CAMNT_0012858513 /DNA_START=99 /DNA_END=344 /DNA_ORIENTATION=-